MTSLRPYAYARIAIGGIALVAPTATARTWLGSSASDRDVRVPVRMFGVRDALLGVAVLEAEGRPEASRTAVGLCVAADLTDAVICLGHTLRTRRLGALLATASAVTGAVLGLLALDELSAG